MKEESKEIAARLFPVRNRKGDQTKMRMVRSAIELIAHDGFDKLTFEAVGRRVGTTHAQVRYHFPDISVLVDRAIHFVLISYQETVLKALNRKKNWRDQVDAIVAGTFDWVIANPTHGATFLIFYYSAATNPKYREIHTLMFRSGEDRVAAILEPAGADFGRSAAEMRALGLSIWAIVDGFLMYHLTTTSPKGAQYYKRLALNSVASLLQK